MPERIPGSPCIIIADGDVLIRNALADYLRGCGYKAIDAANAEEVTSVLQGSTEKVDAILADAELPGRMNGFELRAWVGNHHPGVAMILAGNIDAAARAAGRLCDEGPHLKKPYDAAFAAHSIKRLLAGARK